MVRKVKRKLPDPAQIDEAEKQIREYSRTVKFTVVEYSFEFVEYWHQEIAPQLLS